MWSMKKLIYIPVLFALLACQGDSETQETQETQEFTGFPVLAQPYPYPLSIPSKHAKLSGEFVAPSPGGEFFAPFQQVKVQYITTDKMVFRITGTRNYVDYESCELERNKLWTLAQGYFGAATQDKYGNRKFNFGEQELRVYCALSSGASHAFLSVAVTDIPLINRQVQMHIEEARNKQGCVTSPTD